MGLVLSEAEALEQLGSTSDPAARVKLMRALTDRATDAALPALKECLRSSDRKVRMVTMQTLVSIRTPAAAEALATGLHHDDSITVVWAAHYLRRMGARDQAPAITACARERRSGVLASGFCTWVFPYDIPTYKKRIGGGAPKAAISVSGISAVVDDG